MVIKTRHCSLLVVLMIAMGLQDAEAVNHVVGGSTGWIFQSANPSFYDDWAKDQTFSVGDVLEFQYTTKTHDAAEVTPTQLAECDSSDPKVLNDTSGGATITITSTGTHAYICTLAQHCENGMKMTITVGGSNTGPKPPASAPPATPTPSAGLKSLHFLSKVNIILGVVCIVGANLYV